MSLDASMTPEERHEQELKNLKRLDGLAPYFGFKNASGIRQWRMKFADQKYKTALGAILGEPVYKGFNEFINDILSQTIFSLSDVVDELSESDKFKKWEEEDSSGAAWNEVIPGFKKDLDKMKEKILDYKNNPDEELDVDLLLNTDAGKAARQVFNNVIFSEEIKLFSKDMLVHMKEFMAAQDNVTGAGLTLFPKMFNGEVKLITRKELSKGESANSKKLTKGGITPLVYMTAVNEGKKFTREFFAGKGKNKILDKQKKKIEDRKLLADALEAALVDINKDYDTEANILNMTIPAKQRPELSLKKAKLEESIKYSDDITGKLDSLTESQINLLIRKLL